MSGAARRSCPRPCLIYMQRACQTNLSEPSQATMLDVANTDGVLSSAARSTSYRPAM